MAKTYFHIYDVDLIKIIKGFTAVSSLKKNKKYETRIRNSGENLYLGLQVYLEDIGLKMESLFDVVSLVVPSSHNMYDYFLSHALYYREIYDIELYLDYHLRNFNGNYYAKDKLEFISLIQHTVSRRILIDHPTGDMKRLTEIKKWVVQKKNNVHPVNLIPPKKRIELEEKDRMEFLNTMEDFFSEEDLKRLSFLLEGEAIPDKILFKGEANKLCDAFLRLQRAKKIKCSIEYLLKWLRHFFNYMDRKDNPKSLTEGYCRNITKNSFRCKKPIEAVVQWLSNKKRIPI